MLNTLPVSAHVPQQTQASKSLKVLDTVAEPEFDRLTQLASVICKVPVSLITLIDEEKTGIQPKQGLNIQEHLSAFCTYTLSSGTLLEVEDITEDARFRNSLNISAPTAIRFYAGYPIIDSWGNSLGVFSILDRKPNKLSEEQRLLIRVLAQETASHLVAKEVRKKLERYESLYREGVVEEYNQINQRELKIVENVIDLTYLKNFSDGSSEFEKEMIEMYISRTPEEMDIIENAIREGDYDLIKKRAHKISSSFALMGVKEQGLLKQIEEYAGSHVDLTIIKSSFEKLKAIFQQSVVVLAEELEK